MTDLPSAKYLASIARVMVQYGMTEVRVGDVWMNRGSVDPMLRIVGPAEPEWTKDGDKPFVESPAKHSRAEEIDPEAVDNDPRFMDFDRFGVQPSGR